MLGDVVRDFSPGNRRVRACGRHRHRRPRARRHVACRTNIEIAAVGAFNLSPDLLLSPRDASAGYCVLALTPLTCNRIGAGVTPPPLVPCTYFLTPTIIITSHRFLQSRIASNLHFSTDTFQLCFYSCFYVFESSCAHLSFAVVAYLALLRLCR
jgi:hypothetical protein